MAKKTIRMASLGGGMFGKGVVLRSLADIERCGIAPYLGTAGLDHHARELGDVEYKLVAIGKFDPLSGGEDISEAYFSKTDIPVTSLTDRLTDQQLMAAKGGTLKIIVTETAPAAPSDPYPHPNPKSPCQPGFCDRAINANYFAEILEGKDNTAVIHSVTNGLVFDNPADPSTWHDVTTSGAAK